MKSEARIDSCSKVSPVQKALLPTNYLSHGPLSSSSSLDHGALGDWLGYSDPVSGHIDDELPEVLSVNVLSGPRGDSNVGYGLEDAGTSRHVEVYTEVSIVSI